MKIALIDSGINPNILMCRNKFSIINAWKGNSDNYDDLLGHGTKCADLILRDSDNVILYNIKVFDKTLSTSCKNLFEAMNWCIKNGIQIINLSLSVNNLNYYYEFKEICDEAEKKKVIIVASADNFGRVCLPAYLDNVIGVGAAKVNEYNDYYYTDSSIQIYGNASIEVSMESNILPYSTSFATARITGHICKILNENQPLNFKELSYLLATQSKEYIKDNIIIINQSVDFSKCTAPIYIDNNIETIIKELKNVDHLHIIKDHIRILLFINLTTNPHFDYVEYKLKERFLNNSKIVLINANGNILNEKINYQLKLYKDIPLNLCSSFGKAIIDNINRTTDTQLIVVALDKPIIPISDNSYNFFDIYTIPEISLLFGLNVDYCIPVINELNEIEYVNRNVECLKNMFNLEIPFFLFNSLTNMIGENESDTSTLNYDLLKKISNKKYLEIQNCIKSNFGLDLYDFESEKCDTIINDLISS